MIQNKKSKVLQNTFSLIISFTLYKYYGVFDTDTKLNVQRDKILSMNQVFDTENIEILN